MADPRFPLSSNLPATSGSQLTGSQFTTAASTTASNLLGQKDALLSGEAQAAPIRSTATAPSPGFIQNSPLQSSSFESSSSNLGVSSSTLPASNLPLSTSPGFASTGTTTTTTGFAGNAPLFNAAPLTTTRESHPSSRETIITKETIIPPVYGANTVQVAAPAAAWREAPVITNFQEKPIVTEVIEKPSLEIHHQQHITEIHEKPQIVFQEQPLIVQERFPAQYRKVTEQVLTEDRREAAMTVANPYLGVQPHFVREAEIRNEVAQTPVIKQVIEKPSVEVHQQPIVTEVIERPSVEIHEQEIIRKFRDAPTVMRSTSPVQYISAEQARAMGITMPPLMEGAPRLEAAPATAFIQQPSLIKPATIVTEEVHTLTHPVGRAAIPLGAEIVSTTDPNLKPEVGHVHNVGGTQASPGVMGRVKNALGLGKSHSHTTGY